MTPLNCEIIYHSTLLPSIGSEPNAKRAINPINVHTDEMPTVVLHASPTAFSRLHAQTNIDKTGHTRKKKVNLQWLRYLKLYATFAETRVRKDTDQFHKWSYNPTGPSQNSTEIKPNSTVKKNYGHTNNVNQQRNGSSSHLLQQNRHTKPSIRRDNSIKLQGLAK